MINKKGNTMKVFLSLILLIFMVSGCSTIKTYLLSDTGKAITKRAGRVAALVFANQNAEEVDKAISYSNYILEEKDADLKKIAIKTAYKYAYKKFGNNVQAALIASEISEILGLVLTGEKLEFVKDFNFEAVDIFVYAFRDTLVVLKG